MKRFSILFLSPSYLSPFREKFSRLGRISSTKLSLNAERVHASTVETYEFRSSPWPGARRLLRCSRRREFCNKWSADSQPNLLRCNPYDCLLFYFLFFSCRQFYGTLRMSGQYSPRKREFQR